jgi:hypothetical protein
MCSAPLSKKFFYQLLEAGTTPVPSDIDSTPRPAGLAGAAGHPVQVKPIRRVSERWLALRSDAP